LNKHMKNDTTPFKGIPILNYISFKNNKPKL
jgi:hypothetical protein